MNVAPVRPTRGSYGVNLARAIERLSQKHGRKISQEEIAKRMGKTRQGNLPKILKRPDVPKLKTVLRDAKAVECDPAELLVDIVFEYDELRRVAAEEITKIGTLTSEFLSGAQTAMETLGGKTGQLAEAKLGKEPARLVSLDTRTAAATDPYSALLAQIPGPLRRPFADLLTTVGARLTAAIPAHRTRRPAPKIRSSRPKKAAARKRSAGNS